MSIKIGNESVNTVKYNDASKSISNQDVKQIILDGDFVWSKPFTYTRGTLPTGVASLTCTRYLTDEPTASTGTVASGATVYYGDQLYWSATASAGYTVSVSATIDNRLTVTDNVNGVTASGVTATRITWTATVSLGTGVKNYIYSTNGGSTWSAATTATSIPNLDYTTTLTVKANEANTGYEVTSTTANATYSSQSVTVPAASRIKWSLAVTQSNYIASWTYKINSGSAVSKSASFTISNLDYSDSVVITATNQSEAGWNYGTPSGTGTFTYNGTKARTTTLSSTRSRKEFTITFSGPNYGTWDYATRTAQYGDIISKSGTVVTCYKWDATSTARWTNEVSASATTAQYSYSTPTIGNITSPVTAAQTISATNDRTLRSYTITFTNPTYGSWSNATRTAYYGDYLAVDNSAHTVTCKAGGSSGSARWTNTCSANATTDQYTYAITGNITVTATVTGAQTVAAPTSSRTERNYNVTFTNGTYGSWDSTTAVSAPYSASITKDGWKITVNGTTRTYSFPSDTAEWDYTGSINGTYPMTVGTGKAITTTESRVKFKYAVSITAGTGLSEAYLSTSSTATSGSPSGTTYDYGTTVYAFVTLAEHYDIPADSNWVLVYGTKDATGSKYRVGSVSVTGAHNFGTYYAVIEKYILTISKGTGISTIYYKVNGASSYTSSTSSVSVSVNDLSTYYYYATADSYHTANSDCGSSSSPKSGTVNCADISKSVTTTAKTYTLVGNYTNGSVTWYSDSARTTAITSAAYGSTVYYAYSPNTGYSGSGNGSLVLNTSNFTISGSNATHNFGSATRLTWSLSITKSNYMATVTYQKNSEAAVTVTGTTNLTGLDYADTIVVSGTKQSEAPYNYGNITGAGTFTYSASAQSTTVACTRSVKSYTFTLTKNSNVSAIKVWRTESPYQGAATSTESNPMINGTGTATIYYGDKLSGTASASTGYHFGNSNTSTTDSYTNSGVTGNASWSPTVNLNAYTATFTATNCSWTNATRTIYHFDYITTSGQTVTCKAGGSSGTNRWQNTATKGSETGYTFGTPTLSGNTSVSSVTGNIAISASSTKSRTAFTASFATTDYATWSNGTSLTIYYGDNVSRSGNTVTCKKWDATSTNRWTNTLNANAATAQYTYSATAGGSGSSSVTDNLSFTASSSRTVNQYTITFKYQSAYGTWTTSNVVYKYGDTPGTTTPVSGTVPSPATVTSGNNRQVPTSWDSLATVTGARTITMGYQQQYNITISSTRCTAKIDGTTTTGGWYNSGKTITWTASTNCAFNSTGSQTTTTATITEAKTYSATAGYVNVTKLTGTHCSTSATTGWYAYDAAISWTADTAYAFNTSNATTTSTGARPGENTCTASYVKRYTLTISVTGGSYGTYDVSRTSSPYQGASTGSLSNGATIYYGDVLSGSSSAAATRYGEYDYTDSQFKVATGSWNGGDTTSPSITLTAQNSAPANLYVWRNDTWTNLVGSYNWSNESGKTNTYTDTGLAFDTTYKYHVAGYKHRSYWTRSADANNYTGTASVTGNVTATFKFTENAAQIESTWTGASPSTVQIATGSINTYAVTISATYCKATYLSTNSSATSGSASGTAFNYGSTVYGFATLNDNTNQYTYTAPSGWTQISGRTYRVGSKVVSTSGNSISVSAIRTLNKYAVNIGATTYCKAAYLSTNSSATSGSPSGTTFDYGATVYLFVTLNDNNAQYTYTPQSTWTNITGRTYRVASLTVGTSNTFADVSANKTTNTYTVTFSVTSGQYGSWSTASIADVPYGTTISRSGATVTVTGYGSSTFTTPSTTVQYNYAAATYSVPASVTGATTVSGGSVRSNRTYTIKWIGADGSTALETDSSVAYGATLTYNSSTPTKSSTDQYTYAFAAWKLGSTSGSTVVSGTTTNPGSTSSTTINIYSTFSATERSYTVTFTKGTYGSWSPTSITALYSAAISRSGDTVTVGSSSSTYSGYTATGYTTTVSYSGASGTVGTGKTITATTTRTPNTYTVTVTKNTGISTIYYRTGTSGSYTSTTSSTSFSADYASTINWYATAATGYTGNNIGTADSPKSFTVNTSGNTIAPTATLNSYTISLQAASYGTWSGAAATAYYGDYINISGNTVTCKAGGSSGSARWTRTLSANAADNTYTYSASITSTSFTVTGAATIATTSSRSYINYTITWAYLTAYPDTETTVTETYHYGDTPSRTSPGDVQGTGSSSVYRAHFLNWDDLSVVTGSRTITATYESQGYVEITCNHCTSDKSSGWYKTAKTFSIAAIADSNWSFNGSETEDRKTFMKSCPGTFTFEPGYCSITVTNPSHASADISSGIVANGTVITFTPDTYYSYSSGTTQTSTSATVNGPGTYAVLPPIYGRMAAMNLTRCHTNVDYLNTYRDLTVSLVQRRITITADTGYAFNSSGSTTPETTYFYSAGGTVTETANYVKVTLTNGTYHQWNSTTRIYVSYNSTISKSGDTFTFTIGSSTATRTVSEKSTNPAYYSYYYSVNYTGAVTAARALTITSSQYEPYSYVDIQANCSSFTKSGVWLASGAAFPTDFPYNQKYESNIEVTTNRTLTFSIHAMTNSASSATHYRLRILDNYEEESSFLRSDDPINTGIYTSSWEISVRYTDTNALITTLTPTSSGVTLTITREMAYRGVYLQLNPNIKAEMVDYYIYLPYGYPMDWTEWDRISCMPYEPVEYGGHTHSSPYYYALLSVPLYCQIMNNQQGIVFYDPYEEEACAMINDMGVSESTAYIRNTVSSVTHTLPPAGQMASLVAIFGNDAKGGWTDYTINYN